MWWPTCPPHVLGGVAFPGDPGSPGIDWVGTSKGQLTEFRTLSRALAGMLLAPVKVSSVVDAVRKAKRTSGLIISSQGLQQWRSSKAGATLPTLPGESAVLGKRPRAPLIHSASLPGSPVEEVVSKGVVGQSTVPTGSAKGAGRPTTHLRPRPPFPPRSISTPSLRPEPRGRVTGPTLLLLLRVVCLGASPLASSSPDHETMATRVMMRMTMAARVMRRYSMSQLSDRGMGRCRLCRLRLCGHSS